MSGRPITPPPKHGTGALAPINGGHPTVNGLTPASPTRPGPPLSRLPSMQVTALPPPPDPKVASSSDSNEWVSEMPVSGSTSITSTPVIVSNPSVPVIVEDSETIRIREEAETRRRKEAEAEQRRIEKAIRAEKRKLHRRIPQMDNDDLNALIRSTQKLVRSVHIAQPAYGDRPEDELDLNPADAEEFTLDKLRSHLERFYAGVVFSSMRLVKEFIRIREWEDGGERTGVALAVYTIAWYYGLIFTTFFIFLSTLVLVPQSRPYCFGPHRHQVGISADPSIPKSILSVPNEPELPWGLAASERQATAWAQQVESVLMSLFSPGGKKTGKGQEVMEKAEEKVNGVMVQDMKHQAHSEQGADDMGKKEMAVEVYGKPGMRILGGLIDKWERVANAINPTPPFVKPSRNRVFYTLLLPLILASLFITPQLVSRASGAGFGFVMFGKPVIDWTIDELDRHFPQWRSKIILEYNILADVPTNPQLVLRLMRDAEHQRRPIPHPSPEKDLADQEDLESDEAEAEEEEDSDDEEEEAGSDDDDDEGEGEEDEKASRKAMKRMNGVKKKITAGTRTKVRRTWDKMGELKEESFALVSGRKKVNYEDKAKNAMDKMNISQNSKPAAKLLKKLPGVSEDDSPDTPSRFYVNHAKHGPGHLIIYPPTLPSSSTSTFTPARISFTTIRHVPSSQNVSLHADQLDPTSDHLNPHTAAFSNGEKGDLVISINDIIAMKKTGMGEIASTGVSWALDVEDAGGTGLELVIIRRGPGGGEGMGEGVMEGVGNVKEERVEGRTEKIVLKKIVRRDELFDRLLTLGEQRWELM